MVMAYRAAFPQARFTIWNRTALTAEALAARMDARAEADLETAVRGADPRKNRADQRDASTFWHWRGKSDRV